MNSESTLYNLKAEQSNIISNITSLFNASESLLLFKNGSDASNFAKINSTSAELAVN